MTTSTREAGGPLDRIRTEIAETAEKDSTTEGVGPLLQRDYVAVVEGSSFTPEQVRELLLTEFERFSPAELAEFWRAQGVGPRMQVGDRMVVDIKGAGPSGVEITHVDDHSMTMRTIEGHPETGRITFGAQYDPVGRLVLRIRSRSRISGPLFYVGYMLFAIKMQTIIWKTFLERLTAACGGYMRGPVLVSTEEVRDTLEDRGVRERPTYETDRK